MFCGDDLRIKRWMAAIAVAGGVAGYAAWRMQFEFGHGSVLSMTLIGIK
jgi:hypothetical protein